MFQDSFIQLDDFLIWSEKTEVLTVFSELLEQMCHIVFGLKPTSPEEEGLLLRFQSNQIINHDLTKFCFHVFIDHVVIVSLILKYLCNQERH